MNATKLYIICHTLIYLALVVGITVCAVHFNKPGILWWYLLPALLGGMEVSSGVNKNGRE